MIHLEWQVIDLMTFNRYQEQIERVDRLKDETIRTILKSSSDMAAFKEEVSSHLNTLRQYTDEN